MKIKYRDRSVVTDALAEAENEAAAAIAQAEEDERTMQAPILNDTDRDLERQQYLDGYDADGHLIESLAEYKAAVRFVTQDDPMTSHERQRYNMHCEVLRHLETNS